ncbi:MAG: hypothetical protein EOM51_10235 [Clostridia bacterium]|nr:hypothetical protein [Clostridia bacterium]
MNTTNYYIKGGYKPDGVTIRYSLIDPRTFFDDLNKVRSRCAGSTASGSGQVFEIRFREIYNAAVYR